MSKKLAGLVLVLFFSCNLIFSRLSGAIEPEMINLVYFLDSINKKLSSMERRIIKTKSKGIPMIETKMVAEVEGENSDFIIKEGMNLEFVVQLPNGIDPSKIQLFQFDIKKGKKGKTGKRTVLLGGHDLLLFEEIEGPGPKQINVTKWGQSSYKLVPADKLGCGEFGFVLNSECFCFAIRSSE